MNYELTQLEKLFSQASLIQDTAINPIHFLDELKIEKTRLTTLFKEIANNNHNSDQTSSSEFIRNHFDAMMELESSLSGMEEPFRTFLRVALEDLKYLLSIRFHDILLPRVVGFNDSITGHCDSFQMAQILNLLVKHKILEPKTEFRIPRSGLRLIMKDNLQVEPTIRPFVPNLFYRLFNRLRCKFNG